ncbi:DUF4908 domain-containing protein [Hyphococcus sp. DH-69]|uniref:DUF4908 domain-containing protein n=1 Tax=Hyphococcus formosus TaxID=3143534 RepID=UPI00398AD9DB
MTRLFSRISLIALLALIGVAGQGNDARAEMPRSHLAQADNPFNSLVGKRRDRREERRQSAGAVERYVLAGDGRMFLFEERGSVARVQFLCGAEDKRIDCALDDIPSPEIYQLNAIRGPRGDVIYKNDEGETLLRIAAYGGATVFWPGEIQGTAASKSFGDDHSLSLIFEGRQVAVMRAQSAAAHISAKTGTPILFDISAAPRGPGQNAAVLADAILTAAKGLASVASDPTGARVIAARIKRVSFVPGGAADVTLDGAVLRITYAPDQDIDGRPSSSKISYFLEETL